MNQTTRRNLVFISLVVVLVCAPFLVAGMYLHAKYQWANGRIAEIEPRYARLLGLLENKDALVQAATTAKAQLAQYMHPPDQDATQLANEVQQRIRGVLASSGLNIVSTQVLAVKEDKDFERIPLTVRAEGDLMAAQLALAALNEQTPAILVDGFVIQVIGGPVKGVQKLGVQFNLVILRARP